jgi:exosortase A-associated hydrolase 1
MRAVAETAVTFLARDTRLFGILHTPEKSSATGILLLVGGPQYRVGSHRMFVDIARALAQQGHPVLRFDFSGMGDSEGVFPGFEHLDGDIRGALDWFASVCPFVARFVLIGLCDGAAAAALYAASDRRVSAAVLLNPWVHTEAGQAKAYLWHYYPRRLLQPDFWRTLLRGRVSIRRSVADFSSKLMRVVAPKDGAVPASPGGFIERMRAGLQQFSGRVLVVASGNDLTAAEFVDLWSKDVSWQPIRRAAHFEALPRADHTLSAREDLQLFCETVGAWLRAEDVTPQASQGRG